MCYTLKMKKKTHREKVLDAEERCNRYLADANALAERGLKAKAEILYTKSQYWLDRYNKLVGNA